MDFSPNNVDAAMMLLATNDTAQVKQAEKYLAHLMLRSDVAGTLMDLLQSSQHELVRQLCGVMLRPKILTFWNKMKPPKREMLKQVLIMRLGAEPSRPVRKAIVR
jgi:hypothetical protein